MTAGAAVHIVGSRPRVAIVASHPVQYQAPWYRALSARVDLHVFYAHRVTAEDHARSGFGVPFEWDASIFEGYRYDWLVNLARRPGVDRFAGCNTPEINRRLADGRFDAVVVNGWNLLTYWQAVRAGRRSGAIVLVRGDSQLMTSRSPGRTALKRVLYPRLLGAFDGFLAVGTLNAEYYKHYGVEARRIHLSPHCVDNDFFARGAARGRDDVSARRRALGLPEGAVVFLFVGRLIDVKRPGDFVQALDRLARTHPTVRGLVVGNGPLRADLEARCRARGTPCAFTGFLNQAEVAEVYGMADCLVLPSAAETWGLVVNEAMAARLPAIVSDRVGCGPDLIVGGATGFTYPTGDVGALASCIRSVADDRTLRMSMARGAAARIGAFAPEAAAAGVVDAITAMRPSGHSLAMEGSDQTHVIDVLS